MVICIKLLLTYLLTYLLTMSHVLPQNIASSHFALNFRTRAICRAHTEYQNVQD